MPTITTATIVGVLVTLAPIACGAVHRPAFLTALALSLLLTVSTAWLATRRQCKVPVGAALGFPLFFLAVAILQVLPLPWSVRAALDPQGSSLLSLANLHGQQPLSLDPPATYLEFAKAAAALAVTLAALLLASGRRLRSSLPRLIAYSAIVAMAVGIGHRIANEPKVFGLFKTSGGLLVGPFINANHTAEFLELSAFAALAAAFSHPDRDGQRVWKILAALLAAGAISTLSRGSLLALGIGGLAWLVLAPRSDDGIPFHRSRFATFLLTVLAVAGLAVALGGDRIIDEFRGTVAGGLSKLAVAKDALPIVLKHPAGIGLGAFGRLYPAYQTLPVDTRFEFVENQPVSILLECGIAGALVLLATLVLVARAFWKWARRDRVEASLVAGLVAVLAHNLVDFGLETLGVLLPFCALLGTVFGRQIRQKQEPAPDRKVVALGLVGGVCMIAGLTLARSPATRDFDRLLEPPYSISSRTLAHEASVAHPTYYVYALAEARLEPPPRQVADVQKRLRMLNRAILLCPRCAGPHESAARELWGLGRRKQSILEWKIVVTEVRSRLISVLDDLVAKGATTDELASLTDEENRLTMTGYLIGHGWLDAAEQLLQGAANTETINAYLMRAQIGIARKNLPAAKAATQRALALGPRNAAAAAVAADVALQGSDGAEEAIKILEDGLRFSPNDLDLNRKLVRLLTRTDRWQAIDKALKNLRTALAASGLVTSEANIVSAQVFEARGQFRRAISEYQAVLIQRPDDIAVRLALAKAAEQIGSLTTAQDAYAEMLRRQPGNAEAQAGMTRVQFQKRALEAASTEQPRTIGEDLSH